MRSFARYGVRADQIATEAFKEYKKAEAAFKNAEEISRKYPKKTGVVDDDYIVKSARANADLLEKKAEYEKARTKLQSKSGELVAVRNELENELAEYFSIEPELVDNNIMLLLKSGILTAKEYFKLACDCIDKGNFTMARIISKYAEDEAGAAADKYGIENDNYKLLREVGLMGENFNGKNIMDNFDVVLTAFNRTASNPAMIENWEDMTHNAISRM